MHTTTSTTDPSAVKTAYSRFPSGVTAVCAEVDGRPIGMAASSFTAVSLDPPLSSVCVMNGSRTWQQLQHSARLGISVLAADQSTVCRALGAREGDRFAGVDSVVTPGGAVLIQGAAVQMECEVDSITPAGDHIIVLLRLLAIDVDVDREPLVHLSGGFHGLVPAPAG